MEITYSSLLTEDCQRLSESRTLLFTADHGNTLTMNRMSQNNVGLHETNALSSQSMTQHSEGEEQFLMWSHPNQVTSESRLLDKVINLDLDRPEGNMRPICTSA